MTDSHSELNHEIVCMEKDRSLMVERNKAQESRIIDLERELDTKSKEYILSFNNLKEQIKKKHIHVNPYPDHLIVIVFLSVF